MGYLAAKLVFVLFNQQKKLLKKNNNHGSDSGNKVNTPNLSLAVNSFSSGSDDDDDVDDRKRQTGKSQAFVTGNSEIALPSLRQARNLSPSVISNAQIQTLKNSNSTPSQKQQLKQKTILDPKHSKIIHIIATIVLILVSLSYLAFGIAFSTLVFVHFEISKETCANPNELLLIEHPELYLWNHCKYPTFPFESVNFWENFNNNHDFVKYNCNCREGKIDLSSFNDSFTIYSNTTINSNSNKFEEIFFSTHNNSVACRDMNHICLVVESLLINWDMLEILHIVDNNYTYKPQFTMYLNDTSHYNSIYLKILHLEGVNIGDLGDEIENWKNLEYLHISNAHFGQRPSTFDKLNKISFFKLQDSFLQSLPSNLCSMNNLRALFIEQSLIFSSLFSITQLPDCITNLHSLQSIILVYSQINSFPVGLFNMPNIEEIGFPFAENINIQTFLDLINKTNSLDTFTWNKESESFYSFIDSPACEQWDHEYTYWLNFEYFDVLDKFFNQTNACDKVCDEDTFQGVFCSPFNFQNGVCNDECNAAACDFDGGDCNQLCQTDSPDCYSLSLFDNNVCDIGCNTSYCSYDNYECIDTSIDIYFPPNMSYCNIIINSTNSTNFNQTALADENTNVNTSNLCDIEWVQDGWCDKNCFTHDSCFNDGYDCQCHESVDLQTSCQSIVFWFEFLGTISGETEAVQQISQSGVCALWSLINAYDVTQDAFSTSNQLEQAAYEAVIDHYYQQPNCTIAFKQVDIDGNGYIETNEFVFKYRSYFDLNYQQAAQIDCAFAYRC